MEAGFTSGEKPIEATTLGPGENEEETTTLGIDNEPPEVNEGGANEPGGDKKPEVNEEIPNEPEVNEPNENNTEANEENNPPEEVSPEPQPCEQEGTTADPNDCRAFDVCSPDPVDGSLKTTKKQCAENQAFNENFQLCTRDISSCNIGPDCLYKGKFADPANETSFFWCVENYAGDAFRKFHVQCGSNEVFIPAYADCIWDTTLPYYYSFGVNDEDFVKRDIKLLNGIEKRIVKEEKRKQKAEAKLLKAEEKRRKKAAKEAAKAAEKARKEQEKLNKALGWYGI